MTHPPSRWIAASCATLLVGLTACGSTKSTSSPATTAVSAAPSSTAATSTTAGAHAPKVIRVGRGGIRQGATPTASSGSATANDTSPNVKLRPFRGNITYQFNGTPPDLTAPAGSWYFAPGTAPSTDQIAAIAKAFGVDGTVTAVSADQGGGWLVGPADYSAATLSVSSDPTYSWSYNAAANTAVAIAGCAVSSGVAVVAPNTTAAAPPASIAPEPTTTAPLAPPSCDTPAPPPGVPTADQAKAKAAALFAAAGIDTASYDIVTYGDQWSASVTAYLKLDGIRTSLSVSIGFGANAAVTWAGGFLGAPQKGDAYDRIGVTAAVARLNNQDKMWPGIEGRIPMGAATTSGAATSGATNSGASSGAVEPLPPTLDTTVGTVAPTPNIATDPATCESVNGAASDGATPKTPGVVPPNSGECLPIDATPIVITLSNPQPSLEQLWADDGTVWLLPGYAFTGSDGGTYNVIAVPDQYIQQTTPTPDTTVAPPDTVVSPPDTVVVSPPATVVVSPPDTANTAVTAVTTDTAVATVTS